ncbi:MAG TPA: magnesium and cobalt transport protein CorA [Chloroflexi bacterium]|nr:magnesium and cobalt transport protein CorA [Chloroflexota bacterium]
MIRSLYYTSEHKFETDLSPDVYTAALAEQNGIFWLDFCGEPPEACESILLDTFGFHPLAVDDALQETHVPKIDDWGNYLYLVLHAVQLNLPTSDPLETLELDVFFGKNFIVTHHDQTIAAVDSVFSLCRRDHRHLERETAYLLYLLTDELIGQYMPVVEEIDDAIDQIEDEAFKQHNPQMLENIFILKRTLLQLRRVLLPQREVFNKLSRGDYAQIQAKHRVYFRDVYDHIVRLHDISESLRDLLSGALDTYLSVVNNRMNEIMKTLTIITTLFMPLSFLTGFFGMNFFGASDELNAWTGKIAFGIVMLIFVMLPFIMFSWMRRRNFA